jgi:large subunit ribosomal protein L6
MVMTTETQEVAQSRIGKRPLALPDGVQCLIQGNHISVKGPKGELAREMPEQVEISMEDKTITVMPRSGTGKVGKQFQGLARALLESMVEGTSKGFTRSLDLRGVGYRATIDGSTLTMALGLSHPVVFRLPESVSVRIETIDEGGMKMPRVHLTSHDKEALGQAAARIRSFRPPEPYKGKGVRYTGERIREKAGTTGGKK